ncbi:hypothetical protein [Aeromonas veronii]|uniref:hypothetical protein n=1 Tax=Aeromonas veronii TaxID=654 RepID=UPI003B9F1A99
MINELTWLARHVHAFEGGKNFITVSGDLYFYRDKPPHGISFSRDEWLARRAELQNKPRFADHPDAKCFFQHESGRWFKNVESSDMSVDGIGWRNNQPSHRSDCGWVDIGLGEVLGDWRDTLERRPVDLSEPAGGVKERGADGAEEINAMAQRLLVALKSEPRSFDTGALAEMVELADAEIVKRDAKVCGGERYLNNHWFERGELPPVGTRCEALITSENQLVEIEVICHRDGFALGWSLKERCGYHGDEPTDFRPIRTERDLVVEEMKRHCPHHGSWDTVGRIYAEALYDAGYRKQSLPAD